MAKEMKKWLEWSRGVLLMLIVQVFTTGLQLLSKVILGRGTFIFALMTYRLAIAALCVAPFAFYFERGALKKLNSSVWLQLFVNALLGMTMGVGLYYYGLRDTTPTYALNFLNLVPILAFLLSIVARIEKLGLDSRARKVKTVGVILCVAGAVTTGIYKGKTFQLHIGHHRHSQTSLNTLLLAHWPRGTALLIGSCLSVAIWFILQGKLLKAFPSKYHATMLTCLVASFQSMVIGLCMNRQKAAWGLGWDLQLLTIIYSGALATAASFCLIPWAIANRGPTYPAMFNPLSSIFTAVSAALILGEAITVGMVREMKWSTHSLHQTQELETQ